MTKLTERITHYSFEYVIHAIQEYRSGNLSVAETCYRNGITPGIFQLWLNQYGDVPPHALRLLLYLHRKVQFLDAKLREKDSELERLREIIASNGGGDQSRKTASAVHKLRVK